MTWLVEEHTSMYIKYKSDPAVKNIGSFYHNTQSKQDVIEFQAGIKNIYKHLLFVKGCVSFKYTKIGKTSCLPSRCLLSSKKDRILNSAMLTIWKLLYNEEKDSDNSYINVTGGSIDFGVLSLNLFCHLLCDFGHNLNSMSSFPWFHIQ